jgi:hypothetical protein
VKSNENSLAF